MVDFLNGVPKYVVSGTLEEPLHWNNSTIIRRDMAEEIARLKRQPGKDITILGSGELVRSLLRQRLLDELRLLVHPVVLGSGKRLFEDDDRKSLELAGSRTFGTGVVSLAYRLADHRALRHLFGARLRPLRLLRLAAARLHAGDLAGGDRPARRPGRPSLRVRPP